MNQGLKKYNLSLIVLVFSMIISSMVYHFCFDEVKSKQNRDYSNGEAIYDGETVYGEPVY
jgi:hypothetical protein